MIQNSFNFEPFDIDSQVRQTLAQMIKPFDRGWVADELSKLTRQEISVSTLNNWTAPSQNGTRCIPFHAVPALTHITRNPNLWELGANPIQDILTQSRCEEMASLEEAIRRAQARLGELRGRG